MTLTVAQEGADTFLPDAEWLFPLHWQEIALNKDVIPLEPDFEFYQALSKTGRVRGFTVRDDGRMVGYAVYFVKKHAHYKSALWAVADIFFIHPEWRNKGAGDALFAFVEDALRKEGVAVMHTTVKIGHEAAGKLLVKRGHTAIETGYALRL